MAFNIPAALKELAGTLSKLKELDEWAKLARQEENPQVPPSFRLDNHVNSDIRLQYAVFVATVMDIQDVLNNPALGIPQNQRTRWKNKLLELQEQAGKLDIIDEFIKA